MASADTCSPRLRPIGGDRRTNSANASSVALLYIAPIAASTPIAGTNGVRPDAARKSSNQPSAVRSRGMSHASIARPAADSKSSAVYTPP